MNKIINRMIENDCDENTPMWKLRFYSWYLGFHTKRVDRKTKRFIKRYLKHDKEVCELWRKKHE